MKITEKLYIDRLEKMVKRHKENVCDHCPLAPHFKVNTGLIDGGGRCLGGMEPIGCATCRRLHEKYINIVGAGLCPCSRYGNDDKTNMVAIAWKVIHGWRKDNDES